MLCLGCSSSLPLRDVVVEDTLRDGVRDRRAIWLYLASKLLGPVVPDSSGAPQSLSERPPLGHLAPELSIVTVLEVVGREWGSI